MNRNNQKYVPICYLLAIVIFGVVLYMFCQPKFEEYSQAKNSVSSSQKQKAELEQKLKRIESEKALSDMKMKNLKTIVETNVDSSASNLGMFGNLFETIINKCRANGMFIRSIAYDLNPANDPIYQENTDYNVCELKLTLVGEYFKLKTFLADLNTIENLIYISKMDVSAFSGNPDYLLINISINLYSKKAQIKRNNNQPFEKKI